MSRESRQELLGRVVHAARANEAATQRFDSLAAEALGINRTDNECLSIIDIEGGSITAGRLAQLSGLTTAAITAIVDRLEAKGYVRRLRDDSDRRRVLVQLTPLMRRRAEVIWGPLAEEGSQAAKVFTADELRSILRFFELSRGVNERHAERIRELRFEAGEEDG